MQSLLFFKSLLFYFLAARRNLMGREFDIFGRFLGLRLLLHRQDALHLISNPVSCVRYFEFDYCRRSLGQRVNHQQILDISSPYLFGFYISRKYSLSYHYLNPDMREFDQINNYRKYIQFPSRYTTSVADATSLPFRTNYFDSIISISVIEHINSSGDSAAIAEMWRILKPGGRLILTFPIKRDFEEEYRDKNMYGLDVEQSAGKYFFQRYYDQESIENRLLSKLTGYEIANREIFGEIEEGFFQNYERRWMDLGLRETVKDPYYMSKHMRYYDSIDNIHGTAVFGITLKKQSGLKDLH